MKYPTFPKNQSGAALLAFMLIVISGTSYILVNKLNTNLIKVGGEERTRLALNQAKQALIGYAATYPDHHPGDGPGYLPCPDRDNDGTTNPGACVLSSGSSTSIGRFPYRTLETQDISDYHGERLWYIVSNNFRNNPKLIPLNSETAGNPAGSLTVNGVGDIAAILFAPGEPVDDQNRNAAGINDYINYIDADFSDDKMTITTGGSANYIVITKDELMQVAEKRVLGEVKSLLANYKDLYGAYPWLAPFADPKARAKWLTGTITSLSSAILVDSSTDFINWGVKAGDRVWNLTDGSMGIVSDNPNLADPDSLSINGGLVGGIDNTFEPDDKYYIEVAEVAATLRGIATAGSSGLTLEDTNKTFTKIEIQIGDVVENLSNSSAGIISSISTNQISVIDLVGGAGNSFSPGHVYLIRNNSGIATTNGSLTLQDDAADFITMGVRPGDLIRNISDGSFGTISVINSANSLTVSNLIMGSSNTFNNNDYYVIPRYNGTTSTRNGLLPIHEQGELIATNFGINWSIPAGDVDPDPMSANHSGYITGLSTAITNSDGTTSSDINMDPGYCVWVSDEIVDCYGIYEDPAFLNGKATTGTNNLTIIDTTKNFTDIGIKRGDHVRYPDSTPAITGTADNGSISTTLVDTDINFLTAGITADDYIVEVTIDGQSTRGVVVGVSENNLTVWPFGNEGVPEISFEDGRNYAIYSLSELVVSQVPSSTRLNIINPHNNFSASFSPGDAYRVSVATSTMSGRATAHIASDGSVFRMYDNTANFSGLEPGDAIENLTYGGISVIVGTGSNFLGHYVVAKELQDGTPGIPDIYASERYRIHHDYILSKREYTFRVRYKGDGLNITGQNRVRDVCLGYTSDCSAVSTTVELPESIDGLPWITMTDKTFDGVIISSTTLTIPDGGTQGNIKVAGIPLYLRVTNNELEKWFIDNRWHELVYIAYSESEAPDIATACVPGGTPSCLTLLNSTNPNNDKRSIAIIAGAETTTIRDASCTIDVPEFIQDRRLGTINTYFELENCNEDDDVFINRETVLSFNDQVRVIE